MYINTIMSSSAVTCHAEDSLETAARLMWEHDCGAIPIVDNDGALVSIITDRDVCMAAYINGRPLRELSVSSSMAKQVYRCQADDSMETAEQLMRANQVRRLPVVDSYNRPIGMISLGDIARYVASTNKLPGMEALARTIASVSQNRAHTAAASGPSSESGERVASLAG